MADNYLGQTKPEPVEVVSEVVLFEVVESVLLTVSFTLEGKQYDASFSDDKIIFVTTDGKEDHSDDLTSAVYHAAHRGLAMYLKNKMYLEG